MHSVVGATMLDTMLDSSGSNIEECGICEQGTPVLPRGLALPTMKTRSSMNMTAEMGLQPSMGKWEVVPRATKHGEMGNSGTQQWSWPGSVVGTQKLKATQAQAYDSRPWWNTGAKEERQVAGICVCSVHLSLGKDATSRGTSRGMGEVEAAG